MTAFRRESDDDNTAYGETSNRQIAVAWLRGRLRLAALHDNGTADPTEPSAPPGTDDDRALHGSLNWDRLATHVNDGHLPPSDVLRAILDTYGLPPVIALLPKLTQDGDFCLALAEGVSARTMPDSAGDALHWASRAATSSVSPGMAARLIALGVPVDQVDHRPIEEARKHLLELTREVLATCREVNRVGNWMDACAVAAKRDPFGLATAEGLLSGPGWYTCWLRFTIALVRAEARAPDERSRSSLEALHILTQVQNPFLGDPRACDLYPIHGLIGDTVRRAVSLLDDRGWGEGLVQARLTGEG